jgi:hypothetical protein
MVAIRAKEASVRGRVFCFGEVYSALAPEGRLWRGLRSFRKPIL